MDSRNGEFQEQHRNPHTIMGVCVDLRMGFPSSTLRYSYVGLVEIHLNKNSWGKEILGMVVVWGLEDCNVVREAKALVGELNFVFNSLSACLRCWFLSSLVLSLRSLGGRFGLGDPQAI